MAGTTVETLAAEQIGQDAEKALEASGAAAEKAELPAFLEGNKLPKGYERLALPFSPREGWPFSEQLIRLDTAPGSTLVGYVNNIGFRFTREVDGTVYIHPEGFPLPASIGPGYKKTGFELSIVTDKGIPLKPLDVDKRLSAIMVLNPFIYPEAKVETTDYGVDLCLPTKLVDQRGREFRTPGLGGNGLVFRLEEDNICIWNRNMGEKWGGILELVFPAAAIVREKVAEAAGVEQVVPVVGISAAEARPAAAFERFKTPVAGAWQREWEAINQNPRLLDYYWKSKSRAMTLLTLEVMSLLLEGTIQPRDLDKIYSEAGVGVRAIAESLGISLTDQNIDVRGLVRAVLGGYLAKGRG